jgi:aspartate racemase
MKTKHKTIGILGGMGPEGTAELYLRIIRLFQKKFGAVLDSDFPEIVIFNVPIPDVVEDPRNMQRIKAMLIENSKKLEEAGADFIVIPCNTVTKFIELIRQNVSIPVVGIVEETISELIKNGINKIGLIATEMTIENKYFKDDFVKFILPTIEETSIITKVILNILSGKKFEEDLKRIKKISSNLKKFGCEKIILGCTDLPLLISGEDFIDTLDVIAKVTVDRCI